MLACSLDVFGGDVLTAPLFVIPLVFMSKSDLAISTIDLKESRP